MGSLPNKPYDETIGTSILEEIVTSNVGLYKILKSNDTYPSLPTFYKWLASSEDFAKQYARAKEMQAEFLAEEMLEIADDSSEDLLGVDEHGNRMENREFINRSRLRVDTRKWIASKLLPRKYGDKLDMTSGGESINSNVTEDKFNQLLQAAREGIKAD